MLSSAAPTLETDRGHGPLLTQPLHESMGREVLNWLQQQAAVQLPESGCLAGQSVMSALLGLYGKQDFMRGKVNDVDVFWSRSDGLIEQGLHSNVDEGSLWERAPFESYDQIFVRKLEVMSGARVGKLNFVQLLAPSNSKVRLSGLDALSGIDRLDMLLSDFDLSCVEVGVDLASKRLRWTPEFSQCMNGAPVVATELAVPERTWLRYLKKQQEMPWLVFDRAQILSSVQFAQAFAYYRLTPGNEITQRLVGWMRHHAEALTVLDPEQVVKPLWLPKRWPAHESMYKRGEELKAMSFQMTPQDQSVLRLLISETEACVVDDTPPAASAGAAILKQLKQSQLDEFRGDVDPPDRAMIIVQRGTPVQLAEYFKSHPAAATSRLPFDGQAGRDDLLRTVIKQDKPEFIPLLATSGASFNACGNQFSSLFAEAIWMADRLADKDAVHLADKLLSYAPDIGAKQGGKLFADVVRVLNSSDALLKWWIDRNLPGCAPDEFGRTPADVLHTFPGVKTVRVDTSGKPIRKPAPAFSEAMRVFIGEEEIERARCKDAFLKSIDCGDLDGMRKSLQKGVSINACGAMWEPPLIRAAAIENPEPLRLLLSMKPNVDVRTNTGATPLLVAVNKGHLLHVDALLDAGADLNLACRDGKTPLHAAAQKRQSDMVIRLLRAGAQPYPIDRLEQSPLDMAANVGDAAIISEYIEMARPGRERHIIMQHVNRLCESSQIMSEQEIQAVKALLQSFSARESLSSIRSLSLQQSPCVKA